jgi:uncharacterized ferritin-like protein (DUF455 family)
MIAAPDRRQRECYDRTMRRIAIAIAIVVVGTVGGCKKPAAIDPPKVKDDMIGSWRRSDDGIAHFDFVAIELHADGSYRADTGIRCIREPCPSGYEGKWSMVAFEPSGHGKLTIGSHAYDADLKLEPKKLVRLRRRSDVDGDRDATFESVRR